MMATATKQFETFLKKGADAQRAVDAAIAGRAETPAAFFMIAVAQIAPSPTNPRKHFAQADLEELAASIREQGIQQPILVRKAAAPAAVHEVMDDLLREKKAAAKYEIVTGERRWRAAQLAKLETVPCLVREMDDRAVLEAQIAENLQRKDITALEEGHAYRAWLAAEGERRKANGGERVTVDDLAARIGKSRRYVYDKLQLLDLGPAATKALEKGEITAAHASELVRLKPNMQESAVAEISAGGIISTRELREWISFERIKEERRNLKPSKGELEHHRKMRSESERRNEKWKTEEARREEGRKLAEAATPVAAKALWDRLSKATAKDKQRWLDALLNEVANDRLPRFEVGEILPVAAGRKVPEAWFTRRSALDKAPLLMLAWASGSAYGWDGKPSKYLAWLWNWARVDRAKILREVAAAAKVKEAKR